MGDHLWVYHLRKNTTLGVKVLPLGGGIKDQN